MWVFFFFTGVVVANKYIKQKLNVTQYTLHDYFLAQKETLGTKSFIEAVFLQYFFTSLGDEMPNE